MVNRTRSKQRAAGRPKRGATAWIVMAAPFVAALAIGVGVFALRSDQKQRDATTSARRGAEPSTHALPVIDVYKSPTCTCCSKWVEHLRERGFTVRTTDTQDVASIKASHRVPPELQSCHTALVDDYVIEGHVPAADVQRLLAERPGITGLAVGGMPIGSPGMEMPGRQTQPYNVVAFDKSGETRVFATHP